MLVRTTKRIAGFPPPGEVAEVDDATALEAIERGDAEDMTSLSARLRRKPESPDPYAFEMVDDLDFVGWSAPAGVELDVAPAAEDDEAKHPNNDA